MFFCPVNSLRDNCDCFHFNTTERNKQISFFAVAGIWMWPRSTNPGQTSIIDQRISPRVPRGIKSSNIYRYLQITLIAWDGTPSFSYQWIEEKNILPPSVLWYALHRRNNLLPILIFKKIKIIKCFLTLHKNKIRFDIGHQLLGLSFCLLYQ